MDDVELANIYSGDGLARRIVDLLAKDMTRAGFDITGDPEGKVEGYFEEKKFNKARRTMIKWARLYGGSLGFMGMNDGMAQQWRPLQENRLKSIEFIRVYDRFRVFWTTGDLYQDKAHPKYNTPEFFTIHPISGTPFRVHETRCLVMDGLEETDRVRETNQGWGGSVIHNCYERLRAMGQVYFGAETIVRDFITAVFKIKGLSDAMMEGNDEAIRERLKWLQLSGNVLGARLIDAEGEDFMKHASSVAGLGEIMDRFMMAISAECEIPASLLFERAPAGMNATGENDRANYSDKVSADQEDQLQGVDERLVSLVFKAKEGPTRGVAPANWKIKYRHIYKPTLKQEAELRKLVADTDNIYLSNGVVSEDEVRQSRFAGDRYSIETKLDEAAFNDMKAEEEARREFEAERMKAMQNQPPPGTPPGQDPPEGDPPPDPNKDPDEGDEEA
jgi:phage-related protein (TIGR01555 family)